MNQERLVDIARRLAKNPHGFRATDPAFSPRDSTTVGCSLQHLVARGELIKLRVTHRLVIFYGSQADAEAGRLHFEKKRAMPRKAARVAPPCRVAAGGTADESHVQVTQCPGFAPRFVALDVLAPMLHPAPYRRAA